MISQLGAINTTALIVPDLIVQIVPPQIAYLNGVPTNILGVVGTASWGPKNSPTTVGSMADYARIFGPIRARQFDMGTAVAAAVLQGANNFRCVRVTDGSDTAATVTVDDNAGTPLNGFVATSRFTGSLGNSTVVTLSAGTNSTVGAPTFKVSVAMPGRVTEVFDNIGGTGQAIWNNIIDAINNGQSDLRGPSDLIVASVPGASRSSAAPAALPDSWTLTGGTDGDITTANATAQRTAMVGVDTNPRSGMYALRGTGASVAILADFSDSVSWTTQAAFGLSEGIAMFIATPAGDSITNAITTKRTVGLDSYAARLFLGDWCYFADNVNGKLRLISPASYAAGKRVALAPQQSTLNKPLYGIVGTQRSNANQRYSYAELQQLAEAGIDVITNPVPGGDYFGVRIGHNTSSNSSIHGDNYTAMTNYIAATLNAGMGRHVGRLQTTEARLAAKTEVDSFCANMLEQGQIEAYLNKLDDENNPKSRVALGFMQLDAKITYLSVIEKFLINVEGGQTVRIERISTEPAL